ncbi:molybdenum ABC transporter ATP-binding protein [Bordetella ansorpii]|uniref:Molybdenum ABC transporter ATP-binding protein n=1 Tax=Bordetella ansorpii TaxID=288768 RepID=A0A157MU07_9BORD|nr:ATP-binding cassette domain-containing protein [Bordetella ansorpii]SAI12236.1 molybdenum ABC transporter ATP-binding protein [Bordetella ansorpii]
MIDVDLELHLQDDGRRFDLRVRFATDAPFAALYGPSGAGKSLTLQAIAGLLTPRAGHVKLDGRTLFDAARGIDLPPRERRVGYLFQHYALFPHLTVRQNVAFGLTSWRKRRLSPEDAARVQDLLERFGLAGMADSRPVRLSGGQQQRVALARALACEPRVLLLDEPFAALNPMLRASLRRELGEVRRQWNIPALMISHDADDVLELADVAFVYENGQVIREIDVRGGESRELAHRLGVQSSEDTAVRRKVRGLLGGRT